MIDRFARFPADLARRARHAHLAGHIPALLAHPDWSTPAPTVIWLHGRTVNKELDPGRYLRWIRAGIAACAIDLPGHGERADPDQQQPDHTLDVLGQTVAEIDAVIEALADPSHAGVFDLDRLAIGGMSMGGMATLRRLCEPHPFACAAVECTTGDLHSLYFGPRADGETPWPVRHDPARVEQVDPMAHIDDSPGWSPIPLLALHSEADRVVPFNSQRRFISALADRYRRIGADPSVIRLVSWPQTGAPEEHSGFGRVANEAKNVQTEFLVEHLRPAPRAEEARPNPAAERP
ncbi:MAG: prolyl oligopeptidase family serine peptidase [Phycisphaeraceae bacterium]|nr:prolyl oligopeptidase family serine peptidase [Phycisphaeraceae bacterium]